MSHSDMMWHQALPRAQGGKSVWLFSQNTSQNERRKGTDHCGLPSPVQLGFYLVLLNSHYDLGFRSCHLAHVTEEEAERQAGSSCTRLLACGLIWW